MTGSPWSDLLIDIADAMLLAGHAGDRVVIVAPQGRLLREALRLCPTCCGSSAGSPPKNTSLPRGVQIHR